MLTQNHKLLSVFLIKFIHPTWTEALFFLREIFGTSADYIHLEPPFLIGSYGYIVSFERNVKACG